MPKFREGEVVYILRGEAPVFTGYVRSTFRIGRGTLVCAVESDRGDLFVVAQDSLEGDHHEDASRTGIY